VDKEIIFLSSQTYISKQSHSRQLCRFKLM
jgi:hypothetical protein